MAVDLCYSIIASQTSVHIIVPKAYVSQTCNKPCLPVKTLVIIDILTNDLNPCVTCMVTTNHTMSKHQCVLIALPRNFGSSGMFVEPLKVGVCLKTRIWQICRGVT